jgi:raffinose/stachyose/melibiose transport system permease protein
VNRYTRRTLGRELLLILVAVIFCLPFYLLIAVAFQSTAETYKTPFNFPIPPHFGNFSQAWNTGGQAGLGHALVTSLIITIAAVAALIALGSLCAYTLARRTSRMSSALYLIFVIGIILPPQLALIPLYVEMHHLGLVGNETGIIILYIGLLMPLVVFLYTGFIRALPLDYEEAARVDGAGIVRTYVRVVFPLLKPVTGTVAVLAGIIIWNEFFITLIFLSGSKYETLPVALYSFVGEYATRWNLIFAGVIITIAPIVAFYLFAQRQLIRGFSGGVKS